MPLQFDRPSQPIEREFFAVARRASQFDEALRMRSNLPQEALPALQLREIVAVLSSLPHSTAEGGRLQLELADIRLNEIRSQYFSLAEDDSAAPSAVRDVPLDDSLALLIAAVRTALTTANREAGIQDEAARHLAHLDVARADDEVEDAMASGEEAVRGISEARATAKTTLDPARPTSDQLLRRLNDANGISRQAKVELQWKDVAATAVRKASETLARFPDLLRASASAIETAADVLSPFYDQWRDLQDELERVARDNIPKFTQNLRRAADRLEGRRGSERILVVEDEETILGFMDRALTEAGWRVYPALTGSIGLQIVKRKRFELLIADVVMPDINGSVVLAAAREKHPELPCIVISGYAEQSIRKDLPGVPFKFLPKPFSKDTIVAEVAESLVEPR